MAIVKCVSFPAEQFISRIFLALKPNGNKGFILNLKNLNQFVKTPHFKLEDHRTVSRLLQKSMYMCSIDLNDAYFVVSVEKSYRKFLRFEFVNTLIEFTCLPSGLASAPFIFTKLIKPIIRNLRSQGILCINYLDDFFIFGSTAESCARDTALTTRMLESLGFVINNEKSSLQPSKQQKFLGFLFDSKNLTISLPSKKRKRIKKSIQRFFKNKHCSIREWARFIGLLISVCPAVKYGWLYTKCFEREKILNLKLNNMNYDSNMTLSSRCLSDLQWWDQKIMKTYNDNNDVRQDSFIAEIYSDASLSGWGACSELGITDVWWSDSDKNKHINFLGLKAIYFVLKCFAQDIQNDNILIGTDNTSLGLH